MNTHIFNCYTHCGKQSLFTVVKKVFGCTAREAAHRIFSYFGKDNSEIEIVANPVAELRKKLHKNAISKLEPYDDAVLDDYYNLAYGPWVDEGISVQTQKKYNLRYELMPERVIIPHYDIDGNLVGVRCRNLDQDIVDSGMKYMPVEHKGTIYKYPTGENLYGLNLTKQAINKYHRILLVEGEKSVQKFDTIYGDDNIAVALNGDKLSDGQIALLSQLDISEIIVGLDKEFETSLSLEERVYAQKVKSKFKRLTSRYTVSILWDMDGKHLKMKDAPIDQGYTVFNDLMKKRIFI